MEFSDNKILKNNLQKMAALTGSIESSKDDVVVGDEFIYTIELVNNSSDTIIDTKIIASAPPEFLEIETFVDGTVPTGGDIFALTIADGLEIPNMAAGAVSTVTVSVEVIGEPDENPYMSVLQGVYTIDLETQPITESLEEVKDEPGVKVINPELNLSKTAEPNEVIIGDIVEIKILAANGGNVDLLDVKIFDPIDPNLVFIDGTVKIDGISYPNENILSGVSVGDIPIGTSKEITFEVKVIDDVNSIANNVAYANFLYEEKPGAPDTPIVGGNAESDRITIRIFNASVSIEKEAATLNEPVKIGDSITYTVTMENTGNLDAEKIIFKDFLPSGVKLNPDLITVTHSAIVTPLVINSPDLENGVLVGELRPDEVLQIVYTVEVTGGSCSGELVNEAFANFEYELEDGTFGMLETEHVSTRIAVGIVNFSQLVLNKICVVPCEKPSIEELNDIRVISEILNSYVVKTYKGISNEGMNLTGYKLIINGVLKVFIEYTADLEEQPIHSYHCNFRFSNFIILPEDYEMGTDVNINVEIEDVDASMINDREVEANIVYLLNAGVCN